MFDALHFFPSVSVPVLHGFERIDNYWLTYTGFKRACLRLFESWVTPEETPASLTSLN